MKIEASVHDKDKGWTKFFERVYKLATAGSVKVGWFDSGPTGQQHPHSDLTIAEIAAILEFGTTDGHIPSRSVLRATFDAKHGEIQRMAGEFIVKIIEGHMEPERALALLGLWFSNECKKYVTAGAHVQPENAESTIIQKGSDRPWVDTGRTIGAITYAVESGGGSEKKKSE